MSSRVFRIGIPALLLTLALVPMPLLAQEITGTIFGTITDPTGAAIPDATVTVMETATQAARATTTTSAGLFVFTSLPIGDYGG